MRRTEELGRIVEQLPLDRVFQIDYRLLSDRLSEIPDDANEILRLFDGRRTLAQVIEETGHEDLAGARILSKLFIEKIIQPVEREVRIEAQDDARAHDEVARTQGDVQGSGPGGPDVWFDGPRGAEQAPVPPRAGAGLADGHAGAKAGGNLPPRIVRFPARHRAERDPHPDALPGVENGPAPESVPEPAPEPALDRAPRVYAAPAIVRGAPRRVAAMGRGDSGTPKKRSLVLALLLGLALAAAGIGIWKMIASRPAAPVESTTPAAPPISTPTAPSSSK